MLYALAPGGGGRKLSTLRGHQDEVTALKFLAGNRVASGSRDGSVRLWDLQAGGGSGAAVGVLTGLSGRVCSLSLVGTGDNYLAAGDCSSTLKLWDLRMLTKQSAPAPRRLPNAPGFAGDSCPTAGLWHGARSGVLLSSSIAWWTANKQASGEMGGAGALEEAPSSATVPTACINVHAVSPAPANPELLLTQQLYTLQLGPGVVTCMTGSSDEHSVLAGGATGTLWALQLVRGSSAAAVAAAERAAAAAEGCEMVDALEVGAAEFSDDEYESDGEDEEDADE
ncbi:Mitochondrial division protein 1 [Tetrabaena socialis]|uniref:Mitochondrial division protein 1 n=1 Tax=Tetrabaena socialis TaxID=47790 RepID=A0A2J8A472_9CHLO|nr:Mitochondrial division protein 1 [Tetrabaena socialis]|eukprot:PNH07303.1 Mitochondrial division protein 1 [Tetrabaena socialis]